MSGFVRSLVSGTTYIRCASVTFKLNSYSPKLGENVRLEVKYKYLPDKSNATALSK